MLVASDSKNPLVGNANELLIPRERHVVARLSENRSYGIWNVLVELHRSHD